MLPLWRSATGVIFATTILPEIILTRIRDSSCAGLPRATPPFNVEKINFPDDLSPDATTLKGASLREHGCQGNFVPGGSLDQLDRYVPYTF